MSLPGQELPAAPDDVEERSFALPGAASLPVNGERVPDPRAALGAGDFLVKVGKRRFVRLGIR